jgi:hypothetical protein
LSGLSLGTRALQLGLTVVRLGWIKSIAIVLCLLGILAWLWVVPLLQVETGNLKHELGRLRQSAALPATSPAAAALTPAEKNLADFYDVLGEKRHAEQQIKTLFAIADKAGLTLKQAEYKSAEDRGGLYHTYQILLPVKGPYGAIRQFCEQTLIAIPFASLDEMSFKRDAISSNTLEAKLRITLYLGDKIRNRQEAQ